MTGQETKILYVTALYDKQKYCQAERIEAFNAVHDECQKHGLSMMVMTVVNNSEDSFVPWLEELHAENARFPYLIKDVGKKDYIYDCVFVPKVFEINSDTGKVRALDDIETMKKGGARKMVHFDLCRLMAEVFNDAFDFATENQFDYVSILSGDQILPKEQPVSFTEYLKQHPKCGLVNGLLYFDYSREVIIVDGEERESFRPMVWFKSDEDTNNLFISLMHGIEHDCLEPSEVEYIGTGGCLIPRSVFADSQFRFIKEWSGMGEDLRFCELLRERGFVVVLYPMVRVPNKYPTGELY